MSSQQISSELLLLVGLVALVASLGIAWALSRSARAGRSESAWFLIVVRVLLFLLGVALCWFGVSTFVEG
jgi:Co/Zn/Cd efflux system component